MGLSDWMKKSQAIQTKLKEIQDELNHIIVTGEAGAGLAKVEIYAAKHEVVRFTFDPSLTTENLTMLADLAAAAFNDALKKAKRATEEKLSKFSSDLPINPADFLSGNKEEE